MNAILSTIKAAQDTEAAKFAAATAKLLMQESIFTEARARVAGMINEFNSTPMELKKIGSGTSRSDMPLCDSKSSGPDYARLGEGLRFYLLWACDGRTLVLTLNAKCRFSTVFALRVNGAMDRASEHEIERSTELMTIEEAQKAVNSVFSYSDNSSIRRVGHVTKDGWFSVSDRPRDDSAALPEFLCPTPADWMTRIVGSLDIARYVVIGEEPKKGKK